MNRKVELTYFLTLKSIQVRYKQTLLGVGWAVLKPFLMIGVFTVVFSKFARLPSDGVPYPVFAYSGLLPWMFFSSALTAGIGSIVENANLIKQIYFPREIFILAAVCSAFFDFLIALIVFALMLVYYQLPFAAGIIYAAPFIGILSIYICAFSFFLSALNTFYRDISHFMAFVLQLAIFAVPVVYPVSAVPEIYRKLYMLNPMAIVVEGFRKAVLTSSLISWDQIFYALFAGCVIMFFSYRYFKKSEMKFADIV